ncbi:probable E3 ubiquitin-protein ligase RNF217 [Cololabis saira]|uniref:probable E3 ubiquitin-protein ligase RNF217 n=1 Tax=Cololabis saira TaxID=129043 RepID=UPI002AD54DE8|nr:probable E3 ubiquitin-protein ligase RNF217 [Cololabis saira]
MGRANSVMEDDGLPIAEACSMPSFISSLEEGRAKLSRSAETSARRVISRSDSRFSLDGGRRSEGETRDAEGNNNNNCNGAGARRRASAVEILRRNFGDSKASSLHEGSIINAIKHVHEAEESGDCGKSEGETGGKNEQNSSEVKTLTVADQCRQTRDSDGSRPTLSESFIGKQHVYCTVYCIAADSHHHHHHRADAGITDDAPDTDVGRQVSEPSPEPALYTLDDLVDPFGDISHRLYREQAAAEGSVQGCRVCLEESTIAALPCCGKAVCDECVKLYVSSQVRVGKALINCPIPECSGTLEEGLVISHLSNEEVAKYHYFLELSQLDSSTKPCPQCSKFTSLKNPNLNRSEHKYKIQCSNCQFVWCFKCHAPWHNGLKCRDYRKGDKLLRTWASVIEHGQRNAQKCPQCKIHIQRTEGCDHMTCTQCNTNFCYRCGERYRHLRFFGDHTSNLSVFGCKYRYLPDKPHLRRLIRGSVCATKVLIAPVVILLVIVIGALALVIGLVAFPVYYVCKRRKKQRTRGSGRWI